MTPQPRRIDRFILHFAVVINTVGVGVVLGLLADLQDAYDLPTAGLGLVAAASFLTAFVGYVWLSRYADRGHAKVMLVAGILAGSLSLVLAAFARDLWTLVGARAILGLAEGAFVPAARRVVLDWAPDRPGEVLGRIMAASVSGFALGPLVGALLAEQFGLRVPFLVPATLLLLAAPVITRLRPPRPAPIVHERRLFSLARNRLVLAGLAFGIIEFASFGSLDSVWARLLTDRGASTAFIGLSFSVMALPLVFLAARFGRWIDRSSPLLVGGLGVAVVSLAVSSYGWLAAPIALALAGVVHSTGSAALAPASAALVAAGSPPDMVARGQGLLEAVGFLAAAAAALPTGWAYETIGRGPWFAGLAGLGVLLYLVGASLGRGASPAP
jgi:MFS family permease